MCHTYGCDASEKEEVGEFIAFPPLHSRLLRHSIREQLEDADLSNKETARELEFVLGFSWT